MYAGYAQVLSMKSCFVVNMTLFEENLQIPLY